MTWTEISLDGSYLSIHMTAENVPGGGCGGDKRAFSRFFTEEKKPMKWKKLRKEIISSAVIITIFLRSRQQCVVEKGKLPRIWCLENRQPSGLA
jgi:hypothetical protein